MPAILSLRCRTLCLALAVGSLGGPAYCATIPYTEALVSTFNPNETVTPIDQHFAPAAPSSVTYSAAGPWGSVGGSATANLSTGQLKIRATNRPNDGTSPYMQSNAWFGDGFRANSPSGPFSWTPQSTSRFSIDLTNNSVTASDQLGNLGFGGVGAFVLLSLYQPGTLDPAGKLVGGTNNITYFLYLLGNPNQHLSYTDPQGQSHPLIPTAFYGDASQDIHIRQDFQPNGDFDWAVLLGASGQLQGEQFYDMNFANTLTTSYSGPAGTTTTSSSGLFQNFTEIPEPASAAVIASGAFMLMLQRRRCAA